MNDLPTLLPYSEKLEKQNERINKQIDSDIINQLNNSIISGNIIRLVINRINEIPLSVFKERLSKLLDSGKYPFTEFKVQVCDKYVYTFIVYLK
jgi:hypothetical protein